MSESNCRRCDERQRKVLARAADSNQLFVLDWPVAQLPLPKSLRFKLLECGCYNVQQFLDELQEFGGQLCHPAEGLLPPAAFQRMLDWLAENGVNVTYKKPKPARMTRLKKTDKKGGRKR